MEGSIALLFMGSDGSGPYLVEGPPANGPLPVAASASNALTYVARYIGTTQGQGVLFQLQGSASKVVRITRALVSGFLSAGESAQIIEFNRDTAAAAGGVAVPQPAFALDSHNPPSTATVTAFSTAAAEGAVTASYAALAFWNTATGGPGVILDVRFGESGAQAMTLHGAGEFFSVVVGNPLAAATNLVVTVEWTEA